MSTKPFLLPIHPSKDWDPRSSHTVHLGALGVLTNAIGPANEGQGRAREIKQPLSSSGTKSTGSCSPCGTLTHGFTWRKQPVPQILKATRVGSYESLLARKRPPS